MERVSIIIYLKGEIIGIESEGKGEGWVCRYGSVNLWFYFLFKVKVFLK